MAPFLLAALLAQAAPAPRPQNPAHLHVPKTVRDARTPGKSAGPLPLFALAAPDVLAALGPLVPEVGAWVEYAIRVKGQPDTRVRISLVPPALTEGRAWLEMVSVDAIGQEVAARLLVHGGFSRSRDLERAIISTSGQAPFEIPLAELHDQIDAEPAHQDAQINVQNLPAGEVKVPAGTFRAGSIRISRKGEPSTRLWRTAQVPVWGLIRAESTQQSIELIGYAHSGAHSVLPPGYGEGTEAAGAPPDRADAGAPDAQGNGKDKVK